jgi:hypothetical protein
VLIDRTHRPWAAATAAAFAVATVAYVLYATGAPHGPRGGSPMGLAFGIVGFALMVYAALLGARKKVPVWRLGRAQTWMRGHLWLGLLSVPLILFHGGFGFGGPLTSVLMWLLIVVVVSGIAGAALQHYVPRVMRRQVPMETIFEQIDHVRRQLVEESDRVVAAACGALEVEVAPRGATGRGAGGTLATIDLAEHEASAPLREFYLREMRPFVLEPEPRHPLAQQESAEGRFRQLRTLLSADLQAAVEVLENICEEERQLIRQARLHYVLHAWLLVHVPASLALVVLGAVHAVMALRFF